MNTGYPTPQINVKYVAVSGIAVIVSWILHEFAHWSAGEFLGYDMAMTLNRAFPLNGQYHHQPHSTIISAAGPLFTLTEAIVVFALMMHRKRILLFPFLLICFYMRLMATVISIGNPNDEARISSTLELGKFTLPLVMTSILFALLYKISKEYIDVENFHSQSERGVKQECYAHMLLINLARIFETEDDKQLPPPSS